MDVKINLTKMDTGALCDSLSVLENVQSDPVVVQVIKQIKDEIKRRKNAS